MNRAYAIFEVKSFNAEQRVIEGVASSPTPDRMGDIVDPMGAKFALPMPLLWHHNAKQPVGNVTVAKAGQNGISFRATIAKIDEDGVLKNRCDEAWQSIKAQLVRGISIGFKPIIKSVQKLKEGGFHIKEWEWLELSLVTIPANADCTIGLIKSLDQDQRAVSGRDRRTIASGVPGHSMAAITVGDGANGSGGTNPRTLGHSKMLNLDNQISTLENSRAAKAARMEALASKATDEGRSMDEDEADEFDGLSADMKDIDADLVRYHALEKARNSAKSVDGADDARKASRARGGISARVTEPDLPPGTRFARYAMAVAAGKGSMSDTLAYAERWKSQTPEVIEYIKNSESLDVKANPGTTTTPAWAGVLTYPENIASEFVELLRPATVLGRLAGLRRVPFNIRVPVQTSGATVGWVGENSPKPVSEEVFTTITLGYNKIAGIVVLTEELVRLSSPSAEEVVRRDLVEQISAFMDLQFLNPAVTAVAGVNPASVTNGVNPFSSSGTEAEDLRKDLNRALAPFDTANLSTGTLTIVTTPAIARGIASMTTLVGTPEFSATPAGGSIMGFPVLVSNAVPAGFIILIKGDEILVADDGGVRLDSSNQASLNMLSVSPDQAASFNLWQRNCVGLRAERWITWVKRRSLAVSMISNANYHAGTSP